MNRVFFFLLLLPFCSLADVKVVFTDDTSNPKQDDVAIELDSDDSNPMVIDTISGDIIVKPMEPVVFGENPDGNPLIGFYPNRYYLSEGLSAVLTMSLKYDTNCTATSDGNSNGWSFAQRSFTKGQNLVNDKPVSLNLGATSSILSINCDGDTDSITLYKQSENTGPGELNLKSFEVNGKTTHTFSGESETVTLSWEIDNASEGTCNALPTNGVAGWSELTSSYFKNNNQATITVNSSHNLSLDCGSAANSKSVSIIKQVTGGNECDGLNTFGYNMDYALYTSWSDGHEFGTNTNFSIEKDISNLNYSSMELNAPTSSMRRRIIFADPPTNFDKPITTTVVLSQCSNDITNSNGSSQGCKIQFGTAASKTMRVSTKIGDQGNSAYCYLVPGEKYFLNIINSPDPENIQTSCTNNGSSCAVFFGESTL